MITFLMLTPVWLIFIVLYFICIGILPLGRRYFEGFPYNISIASEYGDMALIVISLIAAGILQKHDSPWWLRSSEYQFASSGLCVVIGIIDHAVASHASGWKTQTRMDTYHNLFIVPLLLYSLATALPLIYLRGTTLEWNSAILLGTVWIATFVYDARTGRLQQLKWLKENGTVTIV